MPQNGRNDSMEESLRTPPEREAQLRRDLGFPRQVILVTTLLFGLLFSSMDSSIVSTSLVPISLDLSNFQDAPWVVLSYLLAYLGFASIFAKLSDIFGRKALLILAWVLFGGFSIGCGASQTMLQLVICRAFQGVGGSGLYSLAQVGMVEIGFRHIPALNGALIGITLAISFVLGPILGGTISNQATWRWIFYINIPFAAAALTGLLVAWPPSPKPRRGPWAAFKSVDFLGSFSLVGGSVLLVFALQEAGNLTFAWYSPTIVIIFSFAALSWIMFITWEMYLGLQPHTSMQPVFPIQLATHRVYSMALICTFLTGFHYLAMIIILPERFQIVNGDNALLSGIHLLPLLGACALGSFLAGVLSAKRNNTSITLIVAACFQTLGLGLLLTLSDATTAIQAQYGYQVIYGIGIGLSFGSATILTSVQMRHTHLAAAQGAIAQARVFGGAIGIAACSIILNTKIQSDLADVVDAATLNQLHKDPVITTWIPNEQRAMIREVYAVAFTDDIKVMIAISAAGLLGSLFTFQRKPPSMQALRNKEFAGPSREGQSETEMDELGSVQ